MDKNRIFSAVQKCVENVPVMLIGTGATIPLGVPGMPELADHLVSRLCDKYEDDSTWLKIVEKLKSNIDLESALIDVVLDESLVNDIVAETWGFLTVADFCVFANKRADTHFLSLAALISKFYQVHPKWVNIITTNYDRVIEYACDQIRVPVDTKYHGNYIRYFSNTSLRKKETVNLLKVHGSLDLFKDKNGLVCSIPLQATVPRGFVPEIITPGSSKYEAVLTGAFRGVLHEADSLINEAKGFLCIGYGFNDAQIQAQVIEGINAGKPIVVLTKRFSSQAAALIIQNSTNHVIIEEHSGKTNSTRFTINGKCHYLDETYWTIEGLLKMI